MSATGNPLEYHFAYCRECDCFTYLMRWAKGKHKASRRQGVVVGIKCCRCKKVRAVSGGFITSHHNGNSELTY